MKNSDSPYRKCPDESQCRKCAHTAGILGLISSSILAVLKIVAGIMFFSTALLADALYSVLDIGFSILTMVGIKVSGTPPDEKHNFGHGKIEFVITTAFAVCTLLGAIAIFMFALFEIHEGVYGGFSKWVLLVAIISIILNYLFFRYTKCVSRRTFSPSIDSLAKHSHADALSSGMVALSVGFAYMGFEKIGTYVAIVETIHIFMIGADIFKTSMNGLLDAAISKEEIQGIRKSISVVPEIKQVEEVKSRKIGQRIWLYIRVEIPASCNVAQFDVVKEKVSQILRKDIPNLERVMLQPIPIHTPYPPEETANNQMQSAG